MVYAQTRIYPRKWDSYNTLGLWNTNRSLNPGQKARLRINQQGEKKRKCQADFAALVDHKVKIKENEKDRQIVWSC